MLAMQGGGSGSSMPCSDYPINHGMAVQIMHPVAVLDWMAGRRPRAPSTRIHPARISHESTCGGRPCRCTSHIMHELIRTEHSLVAFGGC
jgi:hypothetical protein